MALLSNLMVRVGVDPDGVRRGVNKANRELDRLRDHTAKLSRVMGRSGADGGAEFAAGFTRDANGRLHDANGRFVKEGERLGRNTGGGFSLGFGRILRKMLGSLPALLRAGAPLAAIGSAAITAFPLLIQLTQGVVSLTSAALAAAPALIALGAGALIVKSAFTAMFAEGTAARKALEPLGKALTKATEAGSKAAAKGIRPLAEALRKVAQPTVTKFMTGLGKAANRVQTDFLKWAKSTEGLQTLKNILGPLSKMVQDLAPHVSKLGIAFTRMLGRIMGVSTAVGKRGLAGALDWLTGKLNGVNADTVSSGLSRLANVARTVIGAIRTVAGWIGTLVDAYRTYTTEFGLVADALSVVAIVFGGPITAAIGAAGLIIRHFDQVKAAWERLKAAFSSGGGGGPLSQAFQNLKETVGIVGPALVKAGKDIWAAIAPRMMEIWRIIVNDLVPAWAEFSRAMAPIVAWLIGVLGPIVKVVFVGILTVIKGVLNIIVGIFRIFTGILTGDWSKAWDGIKSILKGALQISAGIARMGIQLIGVAFRALIGIAGKIWNAVKSAAVSAFKSMMSGISNAVRGGIGKVKSACSAVKNAVTGAFKSAGSWLWNAGKNILEGLISGIRSAIGRVKSLLNSVTGMIPDWKGPMRVDMKLLEPTGRAIMGGLTTGIRQSVPWVRKTLQGVTSDIPSFAAPRGVAQTAGRAAETRIVIDSRGSRIDDALLALLQRAIADKGGDVQRVLGKK